jgi:RNA polymerase sigma factor (sigma-70 family)
MTDRTEKLREKPVSERRWSEWYKIIYPKLYYAAFRLANGNVAEAQDLTQEAFARFLEYRAIERVTDDRHAISFLIKTCRNLAIDRSARARDIPLQELGEIEAIETSDFEPKIELERMLQSLEPQERELMQWALDGVTLAEMARRTGSTYTAVGVRLHRIRQSLKRSFSAR